MLHTVLKSLLLLVAVLSVASNVGAAEPGKTCKHYWGKQGTVREEQIQIYTNDSVPEESEPIPGFVVRSFVRADGRKIVPRSLAESDCHLRRAFPPNLERAFVLGARNAAARVPTADAEQDEVERQEDELEQLAGAIDAQIDLALGIRDDMAGIGTLRLRSFLDSEFGFARWDRSKRPVLQRRIEATGVCNINLQVVYLLLSYVASLGEMRYAPENFRKYFESDACD